MPLFRRRRESEPESESEPSESERALAVIRAYHQRTKHDFHAYAAGPHDLDWATQPDPFRRYAGARLVALALPDEDDSPPYADVLAGGLRAVPLDARSLAALLYDSMALSAWKQAGSARWPLRVNPSSGNLHPTEAYFVGGAVPGLTERPCVAHYAPREHALEVRAELEPDVWEPVAAELGEGAFVVGLSSVLWREEWKYGERSFRYCQHDVGHAIGAVAVAAAALGWRVRALDELATEDVERVLGAGSGAPDGPEPEHADVLLAVGPAPRAVAPARFDAFARAVWRGEPNTLSEGHRYWDAVEAAAAATRKPRTAPPSVAAPDPEPEPKPEPVRAGAERARASEPLRRVARGRRSAVAMDHRTTTTAGDLWGTLAALHARAGPCAALPWPPRVDLVLFAHRVEGLDAGLYLFARDAARVDAWRERARAEFLWERPPGAPDELALFALHRGDLRGIAARIACMQDIAGAGCFAVAMLADFEASLDAEGAWAYPRLYWECGLVGQVLYLEAEARGLSATGIGCYFDDPMHALLGLRDRRFQSLYHFTVGGAVHDPRVTSLPAYAQ